MGIFSSIFGKKLPPIDLKNLVQVDMHSHLIPGIDDGSKSIGQTLEMLQKFQELGYRKVVTTPHIMSDFYRNSPETILPGLEKVREAIALRPNLTIEIEAAAEYYLDFDLMDKIKSKEILTFGDNYALFELSFNSEPGNVNEAIFEFLSEGYKPILAHAERYSFYFGKINRIEEIRSKGAKIQLNINSLSGHYGPEVKKLAYQLIDAELVDLIGSDCHRIDHLTTLEETLSDKYLHKLIDSQSLLNKNL